MSLYENSMEVARREDNQQSSVDCQPTYEVPVTIYEPNSDSLYSSLGNTSTLRSCKNTTFHSTAGDRHYEKAAKVGTSNNCLKVCLAVLFVSTIISLSVSATVLAFYFMVSDDFKATNQNSTERIMDLDSRVSKLETSEEAKLRKFRQSLRIYDWFQASNKLWYKLFRTRLSYKQAKEDCEALDTNLASSGLRNSTVREELLSNVIDKDVPWFWIGLDSWRSENEWTWSDDEVLNKTNSVWEDETSSAEPNLQRCGLFFSRRESMRRRHCTRLFPYLCETSNPIL